MMTDLSVKKLEAGNRYEHLTVLTEAEPYRHTGRNGKRTSRAQWLCRCDCGLTRIVPGIRLRDGKITRCVPCAYRSRPQSTLRDSSIERLYKISITTSAKRRNIEVSLSLSQFEELSKKDCYYCGESPREIGYIYNGKHTKGIKISANGIDRLSPAIGYVPNNCVPCCSDCNFMKRSLTKAEFLEKVKRIYFHDRPKKD